jgi:hypothetical protein
METGNNKLKIDENEAAQIALERERERKRACNW